MFNPPSHLAAFGLETPVPQNQFPHKVQGCIHLIQPMLMGMELNFLDKIEIDGIYGALIVLNSFTFSYMSDLK